MNRAFAYMQSNAAELGIGRELGASDFHIEVIDLIANRVDVEIAFFTAMMSAMRRHPSAAGLVVLGDMSVQGNLKPARSLVEPLQVAQRQRREASPHPHREQA